MILNVIKKDRNFVYVSCEDDSKLKIPFSIWEKFHLFDKINLEQNNYDLLITQIEINLAKNRALRLLAKRAYFQNEMFRKLVQLKFSRNAVEAVINDLLALSFLDDKKNIENFIAEKLRTRRYGLNRIKNDLRRKGVDKELIDIYVKKNDIENSQKILENIHILAMKKIKSLQVKIQDRSKIYQKTYSHLILKGYSHDLVEKELKKILGNYEFNNRLL